MYAAVIRPHQQRSRVLISQMPGLLLHCVLRRQLPGSSGRENSQLRQLCIHSAPRAAVELVLSGQPNVTRNCIASQPTHKHIHTHRDCVLQVEVKCSDSDADVVGMSPVFSMAHDEQVCIACGLPRTLNDESNMTYTPAISRMNLSRRLCR